MQFKVFGQDSSVSLISLHEACRTGILAKHVRTQYKCLESEELHPLALRYLDASKYSALQFHFEFHLANHLSILGQRFSLSQLAYHSTFLHEW